VGSKVDDVVVAGKIKMQGDERDATPKTPVFAKRIRRTSQYARKNTSFLQNKLGARAAGSPAPGISVTCQNQFLPKKLSALAIG
jgi:hypothetical protein